MDTCSFSSFIVNTQNGYVYEMCADNFTSIISGTTVLSNHTLPGFSAYGVYDPLNNYVYLGGQGDGNAVPSGAGTRIYVLNATLSSVKNITLPVAPAFLAFSQSNGYIYSLNSNTTSAIGSFSVINGLNNIANVSINVPSPQFSPEFITYIPSSKEMYTTNGDCDNFNYMCEIYAINGTSIASTIHVGNVPAEVFETK